MYEFERYRQLGLADFNQPVGLKMNPENRWVKKAESIPWDAIEEKYAQLFPSNTGMSAKPLRIALGSLLIQKQYGYSDRELVEQITEYPYYQYFIGLAGFSNKAPYVPSLLVEFRKRLEDEVLAQINEMIIAYNTPDDPRPGSGGEMSDGSEEGSENSGTVILDATCAPQNISYPQDVNLLNEARENLESLIDRIYRNRENLSFCRQKGIRLSGPAMGRPGKNAIADKKTEYRDNAERVAIEGAFSLAKRCYGLGKIMTKLDTTTRGSIALSILAMNVDRLASLSLLRFFISLFSRYKKHGSMLTYMQNNHCEILAG